MNNEKPDHSAGGTFNYDKNGKLISHEPPSAPRTAAAIVPGETPAKAKKPAARKAVARRSAASSKAGAAGDASGTAAAGTSTTAE